MTEATKKLFKACVRDDVEAAREAIEDAADIHAMNDYAFRTVDKFDNHCVLELLHKADEEQQ